MLITTAGEVRHRKRGAGEQKPNGSRTLA